MMDEETEMREALEGEAYGKSGGKPGCFKVPVTALGEASEAGDMVNPEMGNSVMFSGEGVVERIDGEMAMVRPTMINGEPVAGKDEGEGMKDEESYLEEEGDALKRDLMAMDRGDGSLV